MQATRDVAQRTEGMSSGPCTGHGTEHAMHTAWRERRATSPATQTGQSARPGSCGRPMRPPAAPPDRQPAGTQAGEGGREARGALMGREAEARQKAAERRRDVGRGRAHGPKPLCWGAVRCAAGHSARPRPAVAAARKQLPESWGSGTPPGGSARPEHDTAQPGTHQAGRGLGLLQLSRQAGSFLAGVVQLGGQACHPAHQLGLLLTRLKARNVQLQRPGTHRNQGRQAASRHGTQRWSQGRRTQRR